MKEKEGSFKILGIVILASLIIALMWEEVPFLKNLIHSALNPTLGYLLNWNLTWGMILIVLVISFITTLIQKYATDQNALKELKKEQKALQEESKKYKDHPEKIMELNKKNMEFFAKTFKLNSTAMIYTAVPFILFFRWFNDYFLLVPEFRFLGIFSWFWFYLISSLIFSTILKKYMNVA